MQFYPRSEAAWLILALGVLLLLLPQLVNGFNMDFDPMPTERLDRFKKRHPQMLTKGQQRVMMPSRRNELTALERMDLIDSCSGLGKECTFAEQCCSLQCLKFTKTCVLTETQL